MKKIVLSLVVMAGLAWAECGAKDVFKVYIKNKTDSFLKVKATYLKSNILVHIEKNLSGNGNVVEFSSTSGDSLRFIYVYGENGVFLCNVILPKDESDITYFIHKTYTINTTP